MTNPDSVGTEPKAERESQPMSERALEQLIHIVETEKEYPSATDDEIKSLYEKTKDYKEQALITAIRCAVSETKRSILRRFDAWQRSILGSNAEGTARRAVSPQLPNQEVAPQRGEVGEGAIEWLREQIRHSQNVFNSCPRNETTYGPPLAYQKEILAALSRPPVGKTEAEERLIIACLWREEANFTVPSCEMRHIEEEVWKATEAVAAERALAVTPESEVG